LTSSSTQFIAAIPLNKQLYTFSYICVTAGAAGILFSLLYVLVKNFMCTMCYIKDLNMFRKTN